MGEIQALMHGFAVVLSPMNVLLMFVGIVLGAFIGNREMRATSFGIEIEAGRATIEIVSRTGFAFRYGFEAPAAETPVFGGVEIVVPRLSAFPGCDGLKAHNGGFSMAPDATMSTVFRVIEG